MWGHLRVRIVRERVLWSGAFTWAVVLETDGAPDLVAP